MALWSVITRFLISTSNPPGKSALGRREWRRPTLPARENNGRPDLFRVQVYVSRFECVAPVLDKEEGVTFA